MSQILIADDDKDLVEGLRWYLEAEGFQVLCACAPGRALRLGGERPLWALVTGTTSGTARASSRDDVWRKRNANSRPEGHEAHLRHSHLGEQARRCKAQCHSEGVGVYATGMWEESSSAIPGEICSLVREDQHCREMV